jgi:hypothetical protein
LKFYLKKYAIEIIVMFEKYEKKSSKEKKKNYIFKLKSVLKIEQKKCIYKKQKKNKNIHFYF